MRSRKFIFFPQKNSDPNYKPEIDGLRGISVLAVVFCHANFNFFPGGFVGVDVFFVISGFVITNLIRREIRKGEFSFQNFYIRRLRRLVPALLLVVGVSAFVGYWILMPDEYKNLGQSIVATVLFSNNILLAITSGYWDLASSFKPLLHTWTLGVEEQFYIFMPLLIVLCKRIKIEFLILITLIITFLSFSIGIHVSSISSVWSWYSLPTRIWELMLGAMLSFLLEKQYIRALPHKLVEFLGLLGLMLILVSITTFREGIINPSPALLLPTIGTFLILLGSESKSRIGDVLSNRILVNVGLCSYSIYLWHQPFFAFIRASSRQEPTELAYLVWIAPIFAVSYLTWRFVEISFRKGKFLRNGKFIILTIISSLLLILYGLYLNHTYGLASRIYNGDVKIEQLDKRSYNERVFAFSKDKFSKEKNVKVLVLGNSFARDFANMITESFKESDYDLIYRDDLQECITKNEEPIAVDLFKSAEVIIFASGSFEPSCLRHDLNYASKNGKRIFYIGTKDFGYNLNWLIRKEGQDLSNQVNRVPFEIIREENIMAASIPRQNFISLLAISQSPGLIPITDNKGKLLSTDRKHLTFFGAQYFGELLRENPEFSSIFLD